MKIVISFTLLLITVGCFFLSACSKENSTTLTLIKAEPQADATVNSPPNALRLFFDSAPDAQSSQIILRGPQGEIPTMGMHTMGMNDLMIMVNRPTLPDGQYEVSWKAVSVNHTESISDGTYAFVIEASQEKLQ